MPKPPRYYGEDDLYYPTSSTYRRTPAGVELAFYFLQDASIIAMDRLKRTEARASRFANADTTRQVSAPPAVESRILLACRVPSIWARPLQWG